MEEDYFIDGGMPEENLPDEEDTEVSLEELGSFPEGDEVYGMELDFMGDMPERKMRATRLHMELSMKAENKVQIVLRDMGFGEIYPATGQTWQEEFEI